MRLHALRASNSFTVFVVCVAVFSDVLLQNLVVPVLPYALEERVGLTDDADVQRWNSILLAAFGMTFMLGSCTYWLEFFLSVWACGVKVLGRWCILYAHISPFVF